MSANETSLTPEIAGKASLMNSGNSCHWSMTPAEKNRRPGNAGLTRSDQRRPRHAAIPAEAPFYHPSARHRENRSDPAGTEKGPEIDVIQSAQGNCFLNVVKRRCEFFIIGECAGSRKILRVTRSRGTIADSNGKPPGMTVRHAFEIIEAIHGHRVMSGGERRARGCRRRCGGTSHRRTVDR